MFFSTAQQLCASSPPNQALHTTDKNNLQKTLTTQTTPANSRRGHFFALDTFTQGAELGERVSDGNWCGSRARLQVRSNQHHGQLQCS